MASIDLTHDGRDLINQVAWDLVKAHAPQEAPLYTRKRDAFYANPEKPPTVSAAEDEAMGAGSLETILTYSQYVFPFILPILTLIVHKAAEATATEVSKQTVQRVFRLFDRKQTPEKLFTPRQLADLEVDIARIADEELARLGWKPEDAIAARDQIIRRLRETQY